MAMSSARRCYELGRLLRRAIETFPDQLRVVLMGSGSFSLEVWGPRIAPGKPDGVPDPDWVTSLCGYFERGETERILNEASEAKLLGAGNVGGELLNWIVMLGAYGEGKPLFVKPQMANGHAYAAWRRS